MKTNNLESPYIGTYFTSDFYFVVTFPHRLHFPNTKSLKHSPRTLKTFHVPEVKYFH